LADLRVTGGGNPEVGVESSALARVFGNPDIRRLGFSWAALVLGGSAYQLALAVYALRHGGESAVGVAFAVQVLPVAALGPFVSVLADRLPRRQLMVAIDALRCACTGAVAIAVAGNAGLPLVLLLGAPGALASSAYEPSARALLPSLAREPRELTATNIVFSGIEHGGLLVGPALVGVALALIGQEWIFAAGSVLFGCSGLAVAGLRGGRERPARSQPGRAWRAELTAGMRTVAAHEGVRVLVGLYALLAFGGGALQVLAVLVAHQLTDYGDAGVGLLFAALGVGGLLGTLVATRLAGRRGLTEVLAFGVILWGVGLAVIGVVPAALTALAGMLVVGVASVLGDVSVVTLLQRIVPEEVLGRVFGVLGSVLLAMYGIGAVLMPVLVAAIGLPAVLLGVGAALPLVVVVLWSHLRLIDAVREDVAANLPLLRQLDIFRLLPGPTLEVLARNLTELRFGDGEAIVRQGEEGDRFYVVAEGTVEVLVDDVHRRFQGPGEGFGEIALLRNAPRTATVTARGPVRLLALARQPFLSAVTGHPLSAAAADLIVTTRLGGAPPRWD
jgi:MFS family permease